MRRPSLSTKLFAAAVPLLVAVAALLALTVRSDLNDVQSAEAGAELGATWDPLITALTSVETEVAETAQALTGAGGASVDLNTLSAGRRATDQAINDLRADIEGLGAFDAASKHITSSRSSLSAARRNLDMAAVAPDLIGDTDPLEAYDSASRELVSVGQLLPAEAGDPELGRELLAVVKLAEAKLAANGVIHDVIEWQADPSDRAPLTTARGHFAELEAVLGEFEAIAPEEWAAQYRQSGFTTQISGYRADLESAARAAANGEAAEFDTEGFAELIGNGVTFQSQISQSIIDRAEAEAADARQSTLIRIGIILAAILIAATIAWWISRSITRRVKAVSASAIKVADEQLPALVEAIRDPRGKAVMPDIEPVNAKGGDEIAELAHAFNSMQNTLVDVAHEQVEVLRRGVSDIFITMARRNRSLIDRQLSMLDEYEAEVDDPDVLANYYELDHLSTRMRRNSESLLVLANAEPKQRRVKATEIDDVIRASIGEVEDYRRVEVEALESLQVRGNVVADVSHMLAELLDNATSFSPPDSVVRIGGRLLGNAYMIRIVDSGVGIGLERLGELNELLREPPVVGLSVEATLGMSVVSLLANKHGIEVTLSAGSPGLVVDVVLPSTLFGPIDAPMPQPVLPGEPAQTPPPEAAPLVAWGDEPRATVTADESFVPAAANEFDTYQRQPEPVAAQPAADWTNMSLDLSALEGTATEGRVEEPEAELPPPSIDGRSSAEFTHPPAPPIGTSGLAQRPVVPRDARPAPNPTRQAPTDKPLLPTRSPSSGPDGGPDRLADLAPSDSPLAAAGEASALSAALSAFDSGRNDGDPALPTRSREAARVMAVPTDEPPSTSQSRLDPEALRERLRAFQTEFRSVTTDGDTAATDHDDNNDFGGNAR